MGIHGLTSYVDTLPFGEGKVWESYDLQDTKVVIDGCGLYYHIYTSNRINFKYGGQYDQLQKKLKEFFTKLWSHNVVPYVIFDGIMTGDEKKFDTFVKRKKQCIRRVKNLWASKNCDHSDIVPPRLLEMSVVQVLQELKVPYVVADFEADCEIASLANELDAPVMACDSDFYIFNIKCGYIPFQDYNFSGTNITVRRFNHSGFTKHLGIDSSMTPLLASLIGNDYVSDEMLRPFAVHIEKLVGSSTLDPGGRKCKVPTIARFLSKYKSVSEAIDDVIGLYSNDKLEFEKVLHLSIEEYQMKHSNLIGYFDSGHLSCTMRTYEGHLLPEWIVKLFREGLISSKGLSCLCNRKVFLRTQCEDLSLPSAQECAQDLRWYYIALVSDTVVPSITELPSQNKASRSCVVPHDEIELEKDLHQSVSGLTLESPVEKDTKNFIDTPSEPEGTFGKCGEPSMISVETEPSKDGTLNLTTGQLDIKATHHGSMSPSASDATQIKDSKNSTVDSDSDHELNFQETSTKGERIVQPSNRYHDGKNYETLQATSGATKRTDAAEDIIITEFQREGSTLGQRKVNLTQNVPDVRIEFHDIPKMLDQEKKSHFLSILHSDFPFILHLPVKHQLVAAALRYWITHANVKPAHLAALLVHYVGEKQSSTTSKFFQDSIEAVHAFSQWQNVLYWVERLNSLFSYSFEQLHVTKLFNGTHLCMVYERLRVIGTKFAESMVTNANVYRLLYDVITKDLPRDCQFNQSRRSQRQQNKRGKTSEGRKEMTGENPNFLKGNKFALLCALGSDDDE